MDDAGVVETAVIDDKPTADAEELEKPSVEPESQAEPIEPQAGKRALPTLRLTREHTDELVRVATKFGMTIARIVRRVFAIGAGVAMFVWQLIRQVPPVLQLLGALGLSAMVSIAGSVVLDNALGRTCAVVFVPAFALAFGVVAHHWYLSFNAAGGAGNHSAAAAEPTVDLQRSVEYVDSKLAFALNALGTDRQQQAVIALIQAKTATELSFGPGQEPVRPSSRPRIRAGGLSKTSARESVSAAEIA